MEWAIPALPAHAFCTHSHGQETPFPSEHVFSSLSRNKAERLPPLQPPPPRLLVLQQEQAGKASGPSSRVPGLAGWTRPSHRHRPGLSCRRGREISSASGYADGREPGRSTQTAGGSRTGPALSSPLPGTALQPKVGRRVGGQAQAAGPTLTWRLCSPSRQAEIKVTGVSLVGLPGAGTPQDPEAPTSLDPAPPRPLCEWGHVGGWGSGFQSYVWAHSSPGK